MESAESGKFLVTLPFTTPEGLFSDKSHFRIRLNLVKHLEIKIRKRSFTQRFDDSMSLFGNRSFRPKFRSPETLSSELEDDSPEQTVDSPGLKVVYHLQKNPEISIGM